MHATTKQHSGVEGGEFFDAGEGERLWKADAYGVAEADMGGGMV
jgi:hypothetical protein